MGADKFQKVQAGDQLAIGADTFNSMIDAAEAHARRQLGNRRKPTSVVKQPDIVRIRNESDAARSRFDVLGISGLVIEPGDNWDEFQNGFCLSGVTPDSDTHTGKFVILLEPIGVNAIGKAYVSGMVPVQLYRTDADHEYCEIENAVPTHVKSGATGSAQIVWSDGETGTGWALVRFPAGTAAGRRCTALIKTAMESTDSTHTVDNVEPITGTSPVDESSDELTVYNIHDWDADDNADCRIEWNETTEQWEIYQVTCPA